MKSTDEIFIDQHAEEMAKQHEQSMQYLEQQYTEQLLKLPENIDKDAINRIASDLYLDVLDGYKDPLKALVELKAYQKAFEIAIEKIEDLAHIELKKYGNKTTIKGASISYKNGSVRYDYSNVTAIQNLKEALKRLENMSKSAPAEGLIMATGEIIERPIETHTKDSIIISFI